jgi:hypothetical protein
MPAVIHDRPSFITIIVKIWMPVCEVHWNYGLSRPLTLFARSADMNFLGDHMIIGEGKTMVKENWQKTLYQGMGVPGTKQEKQA